MLLKEFFSQRILYTACFQKIFEKITFQRQISEFEEIRDCEFVKKLELNKQTNDFCFIRAKVIFWKKSNYCCDITSKHSSKNFTAITSI